MHINCVRFKEGRFTPSYKATIGADFSSHDVTVSGETACLQVWDTAGQERFSSLGGAFYKGSDCCIIVFDVTQLESFNNVGGWKREFLEHTSNKDVDNFPFVLVGNKVDREEDRRVSPEKAKAWCKANGNVPYFEASAKTGTSVNEAFMTVAELALKNRKSTV